MQDHPGNQTLRQRAPSAPAAPAGSILRDAHRRTQFSPLERLPEYSIDTEDGEIGENRFQIHDRTYACYFNNRVFFLTVSQSPNVEQLRSKFWRMVSGNSIMDNSNRFPQINFQYQVGNSARALLVLDDVWTLSVLEQLLIKIPGCKILVVSRLKFPPSVVDCSYEMNLLTENEAMSLFCHFAFGQTSIPLSADKELVKQVI
ncbi:hypothetical protein ABFS82_13G050400 [Erythranthe guttata]